MSRYPPADFRGPRDRSRSPPRFSDRRPSAASIGDGRPQPPSRAGSDLPRVPRTNFDGQRPPPSTSPGPPSSSRPQYTSLRDAPPLGSVDRARSYRDREYDRRVPSPRDRSPPRGFKDSRDFPPRDLDRNARDLRDGPLSTGSNYSDGQPFSGAASSRGGFARGRARGEFSTRGGRGGRSITDDRDLFRRERSPPPRWGRDLSRDSRDSDRRDDRRFERRDDDRRPPEWQDRERERDLERGRRELPPQRLESRHSAESLSNAGASSQPSQINPARLALIESSGADTSIRRPSMQSDALSSRDTRRDQPETPAYLNGRAETNRYGSRGSSPPTQAPPSVPAFTLSFAPPAASAAPSSQPAPSSLTPKIQQESKPPTLPFSDSSQTRPTSRGNDSTAVSAGIPTAPKVPPAAPKAQLVSPPPPSAPKAPRAHDLDEAAASNINRLQSGRPQDNASGYIPISAAPSAPRADFGAAGAPVAAAQINASNAASAYQSVSPNMPQTAKVPEMQPPTGPRASRMSPLQPTVSPRIPFTSPRAETVAGVPRAKTPPLSAPSGPRNPVFSTSPKAPNSTVPTEPKANRMPTFGGRPSIQGSMQSSRVIDKPMAAQPWALPPGPRGGQWHQWRRPGAPGYADKTVPAKRDIYGEEKARPPAPLAPTHNLSKPADNALTSPTAAFTKQADNRKPGETEAAPPPPKRAPTMIGNHSAKQSFFGQPSTKEEEASSTSDNAQEPPSSSDDDDSDLENDLAFLVAKYEREKRLIEAQMVDLSAREYRATTPLETAARLACISTQDLERVHSQMENAMDVDKSPVDRRRPTLPVSRRSSDSDGPVVRTPKDEEDDRVRIRSSDESSEGIRRIRRATPEPVNLPYLLKGGQSPLVETGLSVGGFGEDVKRQYLEAMEDDLRAEGDELEHLEQIFDLEYRKWREECEYFDHVKQEQEKLEREQSLEPKMEIDTSSVTANPILEGRRLYKFSSEYEMEQVLKQSEETARIERERQERETRKNQADMEKEARICDQATQEEIANALFIDNNRHRGPEELSAVFTYLPPVDDFTEQERHVFIGAFKQTPKKWGYIAQFLPGRSYQECIRHYYANKWDGRFRDKTRKMKGGRRGRGGARGPRGRAGGLMADLVRNEDLLTAENMSEKGRPRRAAAPTTFAEKEAESKANLLGATAGKKQGATRNDGNGDGPADKPGKRQKRAGEKPGRKPNKTNHALLAAAPDGSPRNQFMHSAHSKEDMADASLLTGFQAGHNGLNDPPMVYRQDGQMHHTSVMPHFEEMDRSKASAGAPAKTGASSYWSVPEQNDFVKYIGYFGRDFQAIASHMGTKTTTMIKNHYARQVDGGNRPELERAANEADERRARGEDIGPPPTPTPIQKRKYENPPVPAQRTIAPQGEGTEMEESGGHTRMPAVKHGSPAQYPPQPRFTSAIPKTSSTAARIVPSPLTSAAAPMSAISNSYSSKTMQNPLGSRASFMSEARLEGVPHYRPSQDGRTILDAQGPEYLRNLAQERDRAARKQERAAHPERHEPFHMHPSIARNPAQGSPLSQPIQQALERKPIVEERPASPARAPFGSGRPLFGLSNFMSPAPHSAVTGRTAFNMSPTKREDIRPGSLSAVPPISHSVAPPPAPEPKRSNVMSLLNSDSEPPKPFKIDPTPLAPPKAASPVQRTFSSASGGSEGAGARREPSFGQPSGLQSHLRRESFGAQSSTPTTMPPSLKHESSNGHGTSSQGRKPDWATYAISNQTIRPSPPTPTIDRDGRSTYHQHHSILSALGPRANPSPPPLGSLPHSRTSSLTSQTNHQAREQMRTGLSGQQHSSSQQGLSALNPNPYASQPPSSLSQQSTSAAQNHAHHSQNSSLGGPFPTFHQRTVSRDEYARHEPSFTARREREEQEAQARWRHRETIESDLQRRGENPYRQRQPSDPDGDRQQSFNRTSHQPLQPPPFSSSSFGPSRTADVRSQSRMDVEMHVAMQQQDADRRRQQEGLAAREREQQVEHQRRPEEALYRRTPLGGAYGVPPPSAPRR